MRVLPFDPIAWHSFTTSLDGAEYGFCTYFSERDQVWRYDLSLAQTGEILAAGVPVLLGCDQLAPFGLGLGSIFAVDVAAAAATEQAGVLSQGLDAGPDDLGARVILVYLAPGEVLP